MQHGDKRVLTSHSVHCLGRRTWLIDLSDPTNEEGISRNQSDATPAGVSWLSRIMRALLTELAGQLLHGEWPLKEVLG